MVMLRAFRPLRYDPAIVGDLASVVAPPYDVISDRDRDVLYERSPWNAVRLILNRDQDRYRAAASLLAKWRAEGVLVRERHPLLCYYVENFRMDGVLYERTGLIGTVRLELFSEGRIRPHERTFARAKQDRLQLLRACRTNLSSIFGMFSGGPELLAPARHAAGGRPPDIALAAPDGGRHRLWLLTGSEVIHTLAQALADQTVFIADGHHRYETALEYRDMCRREGGVDPEAAYNFVMMYLTSMRDPGLMVLPTHRVLLKGALVKPGQLLARLKQSFAVRPVGVSDVGALRAALSQAPRGRAFGLAIAGVPERFVVTLTDVALLERFAGEMAPAVRALDVTLVDTVVLRGLAGIDIAAAERSGRLIYLHDDVEALRALELEAEAVLLLAPPRLDDVEAVCLSGQTMPQKSTYFYPKLLTGLVFNPLDGAGPNGSDGV